MTHYFPPEEFSLPSSSEDFVCKPVLDLDVESGNGLDSLVNKKAGSERWTLPQLIIGDTEKVS